MSDAMQGKITDRLRRKYPVGPELSNGEPEFGFRQITGFIPPIQLEAANRIEALETERDQLSVDVGCAQTAFDQVNHECSVHIDRIAELEAELERHRWVPTHEHKNGGVYQFIASVDSRLAGTGFVPSILYKSYNGDLYTRDVREFADKFNPISPPEGG